MMINFDELFLSEQVKLEYKKTFLLNVFKKMCVKMKKNNEYEAHIRKLFLESRNRVITVQVILKNEYNIELNEDDILLFATWLEANLRKLPKRKPIPNYIKNSLYLKQKGKCASCLEDLGEEYSKIHVDHIIPWDLVGDELEDNYQLLCEVCNKCKSSKVDYIFKNLINLN